VRRLASDGATVAFTYVASEAKAAALVAEIEADGGRALAINADSADPQALQRAVMETASRFGGLDILINNAGILLRGPVDAFSLADFDRMLAINVRAVFVAAQTAVVWVKAAASSPLAALRRIAAASPVHRSTA
jgi:3-oxoacyl-[acyl-carrier protein] reductase